MLSSNVIAFLSSLVLPFEISTSTQLFNISSLPVTALVIIFSLHRFAGGYRQLFTKETSRKIIYFCLLKSEVASDNNY